MPTDGTGPQARGTTGAGSSGGGVHEVLGAGSSGGGVHEVLGVVVEEASPTRVVMSLPVGERVHQPYGILHGGVSALLAESAASFGAALAAPPGSRVVGIELNASHLRAMREGVLRAVATPVRVGRTVQVWEIRLADERDREICRSRCTLAVVAGPSPTDPG